MNLKLLMIGSKDLSQSTNSNLNQFQEKLNPVIIGKFKNI